MDFEPISESEIAKMEQASANATELPEGSYAVDASDSLYGDAFRRHLLFMSWLHGPPRGLDRATSFYNAYYWFLKFSRLHMLKHGYDAGLEQQAFKMLENADVDVDWSIVESIDNRVGEELKGLSA